MTHAHEDHMGGMNAVLKNFRPAELWTGAVAESPEWRSVRETANRLHIKIRTLTRTPAFAFNGTSLEILAPATDYEPAPIAKNDDSLVLRIQFKDRSFLLTGDMEKKIEDQLFYEGLLQHNDVLKVGHHGSRTSTAPDLLETVHPAFGIISAGFDNSYGHPHPLILAALTRHNVRILRTDQQGLISILTDGHHLTINTAAHALP
jgi:competence protein ComEC